MTVIKFKEKMSKFITNYSVNVCKRLTSRIKVALKTCFMLIWFLKSWCFSRRETARWSCGLNTRTPLLLFHLGNHFRTIKVIALRDTSDVSFELWLLAVTYRSWQHPWNSKVHPTNSHRVNAPGGHATNMVFIAKGVFWSMLHPTSNILFYSEHMENMEWKKRSRVYDAVWNIDL